MSADMFLPRAGRKSLVIDPDAPLVPVAVLPAMNCVTASRASAHSGRRGCRADGSGPSSGEGKFLFDIFALFVADLV